MRYRTQLIPTSRPQRPGTALKATSITVHNTADPDATAKNVATYFGSRDLRASAHIAVDDIEAVLMVPLDERSWHAGSANSSSIGIEVCEFTDPRRHAAAESNAVALMRAMMAGTAPAGFNAKGVTTLRTHKSWTGKDCPRKILPHWETFKARVIAKEAPVAERRFAEATIVDFGAHRDALKKLAVKYQDNLLEGEIAVSVHAELGANLDAYIAYAKAHGLEMHSITDGLSTSMVVRNQGRKPGSDAAKDAALKAIKEIVADF